MLLLEGTGGREVEQVPILRLLHEGSGLQPLLATPLCSPCRSASRHQFRRLVGVLWRDNVDVEEFLLLAE